MPRFNLISKVIKEIRTSATSDKERRRCQSLIVYITLSLVAMAMTILNITTNQKGLTVATALFTISCISIFSLLFKNAITVFASDCLFAITIYLFFTYIIVTGRPDGLGILWLCLLPTSGMLLFGKKTGSILSTGFLAIIIVLFQTKMGNDFLLYQYSDTFMQRFPLLYSSFLIVGYILESIRESTYKELENLRRKYEYQSKHDPLTRVFNRQGFNDAINGDLTRNGIDDKNGFMLLIMDLDYFKDVNDTYGHLQGDNVLIAVANEILKVVGNNGYVCRWGGEEFAVILRDCKKYKDVPENIRAGVERMKIESENTDIAITVSIGVAEIYKKDLSADRIVNIADKCLYKAKEGGRNRIESFVVRETNSV